MITLMRSSIYINTVTSPVNRNENIVIPDLIIDSDMQLAQTGNVSTEEELQVG